MKIDLIKSTWQIMPFFQYGSDSVIIDFSVFPDEKHILFSLMKSAREYILSCGKKHHSMLCLANLVNNQISILYEKENNWFYDLNHFNDNKIVFVQRYYFEFPMGRPAPGIEQGFSYADIINIIDLKDTSIINMDIYRSETKLSTYYDTLIIWIEKDNHLSAPATLNYCPVQLKFCDYNFSKKLHSDMCFIRPLPHFETNTFYYNESIADSITLLNFETSKIHTFYIGMCDKCVISPNDSLIACIQNTYRTNFWTGDRRFLSIEIVDAHNRIHIALDS